MTIKYKAILLGATTEIVTCALYYLSISLTEGSNNLLYIITILLHIPGVILTATFLWRDIPSLPVPAIIAALIVAEVMFWSLIWFIMLSVFNKKQNELTSIGFKTEDHG